MTPRPSSAALTVSTTKPARRNLRRATATKSLHAMSDHRFYAYLIYRLIMAALIAAVLLPITWKA